MLQYSLRNTPCVFECHVDANLDLVLFLLSLLQVMLALHEKTNHLVAIKEIVKGSVPARAIHLEQRLLEMAQGCPFLSHGLTAFHNKTNTYLVMEYVQGGSLHDFLAKKHVLNLDEARFIAAELICGIQFLHSHGVIHRDLKPENTLMSYEGHVKIADFGLAAENIVGRKKAVGQYGTLKYIAPEVLGDKRYGCSADWWSLGVMICQMITGQFPFKAEDYSRNILKARPCYPEWLSTDARDLLNRLLDKNPKSRLEFSRNIRKHAFFSDIDWKDLELCRVRPPYLVTT
uniref:Protein kinase domain-containing protein n=1 Tax=Leptobrachium leishanense TaxID=445787 RepID=A0A8C5PMG0_9ANUR